MNNKRSVIQRFNLWLAEPAGQLFTRGKYRFWLPMVLILSLLNSVLFFSILSSVGQLQAYMGGALLSVGALLAWCGIGSLHYSDAAGDPRMARGVSLLDSITLLFIIGHFCGLLYVQGHLMTLQASDTKYAAELERYNARAERLSDNDLKIAEITERTAKEITRAERLRNDTAYQQRRAAELGRRGGQKAAGVGQSPAQASINLGASGRSEMERPTRPTETAAAFFTRWDAWIRIANFGELLLAAITFIYIRNRSARSNVYSATPVPETDEDFPAELDDDAGKPSSTRRGELTARRKAGTLVYPKTGDTAADKKGTQIDTREALERLRAALSLIAFEHGPTHFATDLKPDDIHPRYLWIRQRRSEMGEKHAIAKCRASLDILTDVLTMPSADFKARLEKFLRSNGFHID